MNVNGTRRLFSSKLIVTAFSNRVSSKEIKLKKTMKRFSTSSIMEYSVFELERPLDLTPSLILTVDPQQRQQMTNHHSQSKPVHGESIPSYWTLVGYLECRGLVSTNCEGQCRWRESATHYPCRSPVQITMECLSGVSTHNKIASRISRIPNSKLTWTWLQHSRRVHEP